MRVLPKRASARFATTLCLAAWAASATGAPAAATVTRAIVDVDLQTLTQEQRAASVGEIAGQLRAKFLRVSIEWDRAEPKKGAYDETLLAGTDHLLDLAGAEGLRVVITVVGTPEWASDRSLWNEPPFGTGRYAPNIAPRADAARDFGSFAGMLAARFKGRVFAYECWNEPNISLFFYPQVLDRHDKNDDFAAARYTKLLEAFSAAVHAADRGALVIGGATAPVGGEYAGRTRTSPQLFARQLKERGALTAMDAYSHHPYQPGPSPPAPEMAPRTPRTTVTLQNLETLLDIVPGLPFYLTEYGYNTSPCDMFGISPGQQVSRARQAAYLQRAYRYAARYRRVKALFWYLRRDHVPSGRPDDSTGVYTGLRALSGSRKRSWFAFAGGMKLTLNATAPVASGACTKLTGALTCSRLATAGDPGGLRAKRLEVQRRVDGVWRTVKSVKTRTGGRYTAWLRLGNSARLRVRWQGVVTSPVRCAAVR